MPRRARELTPAEQVQQWQDEYLSAFVTGAPIPRKPSPDPLERARKVLEDTRKPIAPPKNPKVTGKAGLVLEALRILDTSATFEELLIAAWKAHATDFGLKGYCCQHPDARALANTLYGSRGMIARGLLRKRPDGLLEVVQ